jgi:hypothetical protein
MDKEEILQEMVDCLIGAVYVSLKENDTWAETGEIFGDQTLERCGRHGMYIFVDADNNQSYGASVDIDRKKCKISFNDDVVPYAKKGTEQLNLVLARKIDPKYKTQEEVREAVDRLLV